MTVGCTSHAAPAKPATEPREIDVAGFHDVMRAQRGHPVIVNFWATWCAPCIEEFPDVVKGAEKWRSRGVRFVSISADDTKDLAKVKQTLARFGAPFDAVLIVNGKAGPAVIDDVDADWSGALPTTFLYDANGQRKQRRVGAIDDKLLAQWLDPLLK